MAVNSISNLTSIASNDLTTNRNKMTGSNVEAFNNILQSAMNMIKETNQLSNDAEKAVLEFAMGKSESTHDLTVAQQKALTSLQYTVAVRDAVMEAYKEIMQLQF